MSTITGPVSIIRLGPNLLVTIQDELRDTQVLEMHDQIAQTIERHAPRGLLLDLTLMEVVDSFMAHTINQIAAIARLMGTRTVVSGLQPGVAITLVEMGLDLPHLTTALDVEQGLLRLAEEEGQAR